jgi:tRNA threonylcarbamoyl adenosine modification protein YjeE
MANLETPSWTTQVLLTSSDHTADVAKFLRQGFAAGDVLLLSGPIGAGKSCFARALIRALLSDHDQIEDIPSPTFTLVQSYQAGDLEIWHSDLYRLTYSDELGFFDAFQVALCIVEWPDRLGIEAPKSALSLDFGLCDNEDHRLLKITAHSDKWDWVNTKLLAYHV